MKMLFFLLVLFPLAGLGAVPFGAAQGEEPQAEVKETAEPGRCDMSMNIGWFARQDVSVKPGRVLGPDFNLHIENNVFYGFIHGKATRYKVANNEISGSAAGFDLMLHVSKSDFETVVRGLVGNRRVVAKISDEKVMVSGAGSSSVDFSSSLSLSMEKPGEFRGHVGGGSELQYADMTLKGCDLQFFRNRPGLIVALFMCWLGA